MTRPIRFHNPVSGSLPILRGYLGSRAVVGTRRLEDVPHAARPQVPYVCVSSDGGHVRKRISASATVRVVVWADTEFNAAELAEEIQAVLFAYEGGDMVRNFSPVYGPVPAMDDDTARPMSFFTVTARLNYRASA